MAQYDSAIENTNGTIPRPMRAPLLHRISVRSMLFLLLLVTLLLSAGYYFFNDYSDSVLRDALGKEMVLVTQQAVERVDDIFTARIEFFDVYAHDPNLADAIARSNERFSDMEDAEAYIRTQNMLWEQAPVGSSTALAQDIEGRALSNELRGISTFFREKYGHEVYPEIFVTNRYGVNMAQTGKTEDYLQADEEWWQKTWTNGRYVGPVEYDASVNDQAVDLAFAVERPDGERVGVLKVVLSLEEIEGIIDRMRLESSGGSHTTDGHLSFDTMHVTLLESNGYVIYSNSPHDLGSLTEHQGTEAHKQPGSGFHFFVAPDSNDNILVAHARSSIADDFRGNSAEPVVWTLYLDQNESEVLTVPHQAIDRFMIAVGSIVIALVLFVMIFLSYYITGPLSRLAAVATEVANGNFKARVRVTGKSEIDQLNTVFNAMVEQIDEHAQEMEKEREKLLHVTENMRGGGLLVNDDGTVLFANKRIREIFNIPSSVPDSKIMKAIDTIFGGTKIPKVITENLKTEAKRSSTKEVDASGRIFQFYFHRLHVSETSGPDVATQFILIFDVTEERQLERSKSELVAVASHQLRTPLTAIRGNIELLLDCSYGKLGKQQSEMLEEMETSTIRLISMVNDMLDITKIEKGELELNAQQINLPETIRSVISDLGEYAKGHDFTIAHNEPKRDVRVYADSLRLRQVFQNLIDNAIKYSRAPGTLRIEYTNRRNEVEITFSDDGIGIPEQEQQYIYDRFYRATNVTKASSSGTGLGLPIVKSIIEMHGGHVICHSKEDEGTTFKITLPKKKLSVNRKKDKTKNS